jgi:tripartite-type tricarboxylate transporter receptor subunit TctC
VLVVHPSLPVNSVKDLIAVARARPNQLNFPSAGNGSGSHLAGELFKVMANVSATHIPYKGSGPAIIDLIANQVQFMFAGALPAQAQIKANRLRAIAVTSARRSGAMPELPTVSESGLPGFEVIGWYGILAPAGTPKAIITRLHDEIVRSLQLADVRERIIGDGAEVVGNSPAEFEAFLKTDIARWAKLIKQTGAHLD